MTIETRPSAAHRWTSYRYAGRYGHIMIGATSTQDALRGGPVPDPRRGHG